MRRVRTVAEELFWSEFKTDEEYVNLWASETSAVEGFF